MPDNLFSHSHRQYPMDVCKIGVIWSRTGLLMWSRVGRDITVNLRLMNDAARIMTMERRKTYNAVLRDLRSPLPNYMLHNIFRMESNATSEGIQARILFHSRIVRKFGWGKLQNAHYDKAGGISGGTRASSHVSICNTFFLVNTQLQTLSDELYEFHH